MERRRRGRATAALCFALGFLGVGPVPGQRVQETVPSTREMREETADAGERTMRHVRVLADQIGPRAAGGPAERRAAHYIIGVLDGLGYRVSVHDGIPIGGRESQTLDIVATSPHHRGPWATIVGAHYDSMVGRDRSPGANDNATGVAVLLETARLLADVPLGYEVRFMFFGAEEVHHDGSRWMAATPGLKAGHDGAVPVRDMIEIDMVGVGDRLCLNYAAGQNDVGRELLQSARTIGLHLVQQGDDPHSDHEAFERVGIPSAWIQRLPDGANHTHNDTSARIKPRDLQDVVDLLCTCLVQRRRQAA
jgi:hypothetical protein